MEKDATHLSKESKEMRKEGKPQQKFSLNQTGAKKREALINFNLALATGRRGIKGRGE